MNTMDAFRQAIEKVGLTPPETIFADGEIHRFASNGDRTDDAGWYVVYGDGLPAGSFGDWRSGLKQNWCVKSDRQMSVTEREEHRSRLERARQQREADERLRHVETAQRAQAIWNEAALATGQHPYLQKKGIGPHGLRVVRVRADDGDLLIVPVTIDGTMTSLQFIYSDGAKRFLRNGATKGGSYTLGDLTAATTVLICEGFATGASLYEATHFPVVTAFSAVNLTPVAEQLRKQLPTVAIMVCGDNDLSGTGQREARKAAEAVAGLVALPEIDGHDFNDVHVQLGLDAVAQAIETAIRQEEINAMNAPALAAGTMETDTLTNSSPQSVSGDSVGGTWVDPLPLVAEVGAVAYPLDALPDLIRAAVEEVQGFTKAPIAMVASSALAAVSVAAHSHYDVKRADKLAGPVSLFLLTIADSGERKSTCDGFFSSPIRDYEQEQAEIAKPKQKSFAAQFAAWKAEQEGTLSALKQAVRSGKPVAGKSVDTLREDLLKLEHGKPIPPRAPKLLRGDDTPENLAFVLAREWPSAGVITAEAGLVLGSHGMGTDSVMRNLALLNTLWDGGTHVVGRRTSESFTVRGVRLTMGLQVQEATLRSFFDRSKGLARGTGFLARFLVSWPESTQGARPFTDPPDTWPLLETFHRRLADILNTPTSIDEEGSLSPMVLSLAPDTKAAWVAFHDAIEEQLRTGGELHDVRDVASKTADNAARLSALFQVFCSNSSRSRGAVAVEYMESASRIVAWHLNEARRFFRELALLPELANPARLDAWLLSYCQRERVQKVLTRTVQQFGPRSLREKAVIDAAVRELTHLGRARLVLEGRNKIIQVNPVLLSQGEP